MAINRATQSWPEIEYSGNLVDGLIETVAHVETSTRAKDRPAVPHSDAPKYWYPRYQEWLSLDEYTYRRSMEGR